MYVSYLEINNNPRLSAVARNSLAHAKLSTNVYNHPVRVIYVMWGRTES